MTNRLPVSVDCETLPIEVAPHYPPPVTGVAIKYPGRRAVYYGIGGPSPSTSTWAECRDALVHAYAHPGGIVGHNLKFDLACIWREFDLPPPPWQSIHDTLLLAFLTDPSRRTLALKPLAAGLLHEPPSERDAVVEWLVEHQPVPGVTLSRNPHGSHFAGAWVSLAPHELVGAYCIGDVERTESLFKLFMHSLDEGLRRAYNRERHLLRILLDMELRGVAVDLPRLKAACESGAESLRRIDDWIKRKLHAETINLDSGAELAAALVQGGFADQGALGRTLSGVLRTDKSAIGAAVTDKQLAAALRYRGAWSTSLRTFMGPWRDMAAQSGGRIFASWNQVWSDRGGTRTGRLSSTWFMNMPKPFKPLFGRGLVASPVRHLAALPNCRSFIVPGAGRCFIDRDYSQQELRVLAHYERGSLLEQYRRDPWTDFHTYAQEQLAAVGLHYDRKPVKITNLGLIYGMGVGKLADATGLDEDHARELKQAILGLYPGLTGLYDEMSRRAQVDEPIRTWGGRVYHCEPPRLVNGRWQRYDYKLVNVLIQGSAADCTKDALCRLDDAGALSSMELDLLVHDEVAASVPVKLRVDAMESLRAAMESVPFSVEMKSEGKWSSSSWGELQPYDHKGVRCEA